MFNLFGGSSTEFSYPELPTPNTPEEYEAVLSAARTKAFDLAGGTEGWTSGDTSSYPPDHGVTWESIGDPATGVECLRVKKQFRVSPETLYNEISSHVLAVRQAWDKDILEFRPLKEIDPTTFVMYTLNNAPFPVSKRNFVNVTRHSHEADGRYLVLATSINHPGVVQDSGVVRGILYVGCWIIAPVEGNSNAASVTRIIQLDVKGSIPAFVINMTRSKAGLSFLKLEEILLAKQQQ